MAQANNIFLSGDAATFVKATTGGGINQSLKAASVLEESINNDRNFDLEWRKRLMPNLYTHLVAHKMMKNFTAKDWNSLISDFSRPQLKKILYSKSRDRLLPMLLSAAAANPGLIKYARRFPFETSILPLEA